MSRTRPKVARPHFVADFETTTRVDDCRVWLWSAVQLGSDAPEWGKDITSFIKWLMNGDRIVHFHNLKFDGMFLLDHILRHGFHWRERATQPGTFQVLIDRMARFYSLRVVWMNGVVTEFRDSLKKLPFTVKMIAQAFKLPMAKGEIDFKLHRPVGYEPTPEELDYVFKDVLIVASALHTQMLEGMTKLTAGSDSLAEYKRVIGLKKFEKNFPVLNHAIDSDIRLAYRGGYTFASPRFKGRTLGCGRVYDVNSLYPSVMYTEALPYGTPIWCPGLPVSTPGYPLFVVSVTFTAKLKPDHIPILQIKGASMFSETEYQEEVDEPTTLSFTNVDLEQIMKHYDVDVLSYNGGWKFKAARGLFKEFIDKWSGIKANSEGALRAIAKLHLNSLYGKFASNPSVTGKYPTMVDDMVKLVLGKEATRDPIYTAMGAFITAYARKVTVDAAQLNYDRFAYCDTDSLHLMGLEEPQGIEVDDNELGKWAHEGDFDKAFYIRAKGYMERMISCKHGVSGVECVECVVKCQDLSVHIAGVPVNITGGMDFEDIYDDHELWGKLTPKVVPGGVVLQEGKFTLKL